MSETLHAWEQKYIELRQARFTHAQALEQVGKTWADFELAKKNPMFASGVAMAEAGIITTEINVAELRKLRMAQVDGSRLAACFGMSLEEFKTVIDSNQDLKKIYDTGHLHGQAEMQLQQYNLAMAGDAQTLKHLAEHHLDQKSTAKLEIGLDGVDKMIEMLKSRIQQKRVAQGMREGTQRVIEGEYEEVEESEKSGEPE